MADRITAVSPSTASALNVSLGSAVLNLERTKLSKTATFKTGIKSIDAHFHNLFTGGKVIGVGQLDDDTRQTILTHLIATHLLKTTSRHPSNTSTDQTQAPNAFIIAPPSTPTITTLHQLLQHRLSLSPLTQNTHPDAESTSLSLLTTVQLLQYLDFPGLTESLAEVSNELQSRQQQPPAPAILLIQGLSPSLAEMQRRSGLTQTCAVLSNLMRSLRHLARTCPWVLVLVEVGLGSGVGGGVGGRLGEQAGVMGGQIESAFASAEGKVLQVFPRGVVGGVLEGSVDMLVCVHDGFGRGGEQREGRERVKRGKVTEREREWGKTMVVEVMKDGGGGKTGEWAVWVQ